MDPAVTAVVPTFNSARTIGRLLDSLMKQDYKDFETIIVDGGSTDQTIEIASRYPVEIVSVARRGVGAARRRGVEAAKGRLVAFIDSDCVAPANWLSGLLSAISSSEDVVSVGGRAIPLQRSLVSISLEYRMFGFEKSGSRREVESVATMNALYRRAELVSTGNFDPSFELAEDPELNARLRRRGLKILYDPSVFVYHDHPESMKDLLSKWYVYGKWFAKLNSKNITDFFTKVLPRLAYWLAIALSIPLFRGFPFVPLLIFSSPCIIYLRAAITGFTETKDRRLLLALPLVHLLKLQAHILGMVSFFI